MPAPRPQLHADAARRETGFSLVEIIVAMLIVAILLVVVMIAFRGSKSATYAKETATVGSAYAQAVAQYQADYARRNPTGMTGNNGATQQRGPMNLVGSPYLRSIPEGVSGGRIGVSWVSSMSGVCASGGKPNPPGAGGTQVGWVTICLGADPQYAVRVSSRPNGSAAWNAQEAKSCFVGSSGVARTPAC